MVTEKFIIDETIIEKDGNSTNSISVSNYVIENNIRGELYSESTLASSATLSLGVGFYEAPRLTIISSNNSLKYQYTIVDFFFSAAYSIDSKFLYLEDTTFPNLNVGGWLTVASSIENTGAVVATYKTFNVFDNFNTY